ncbi:SPOR domain-containing protein [Sulfurimonas sp.]|uniref:SPOR domain-containing protein n=1 Tax=Sulfurimonas sp. TaxID=2022749 RepID=UPI0026223BB9|nr:SPOR domain-containing protein [Sulfurimonas sp.]
MDEKNELSDIVLNKGGSSNSNKKIILAIATLGVVLIVVVMLMNSINSKGTGNLPQAVLPPEPKAQVASENALDKEPLFEDVPVVQENKQEDTNLDHIAKKLKQESAATQVENIEEPVKTTPTVQTVQKQQRVVKAKVLPKKVKKTHEKVATLKHTYFVQVGSFSIYKPNKKFLNSITTLGYKYSYHKIKNINKVLVGPFKTRKEANKAKAILRSKVVRGAFLVKL